MLGLARSLRHLGHEARVLGPCDGPPPDAGVSPLGRSVPTAANGSVAPIAPDPACQLRTIRDEIRVRLHLASAEAKEAWNNLEPTLGEIEQKMGQMTDETKAKAQELLKRFSQLRDRLKEAKPK